MTHPDLFSYVPPVIYGDRDGVTFKRAIDLSRLNEQALRVYNAMSDGQWRGLADIAAITGDPEASVSARLRDLRKDKFGGFNVERRHVSRGYWQYRVLE